MLSTLFKPAKPGRRLLIKMGLICLIGSALCMGLMLLKSKADNPFAGDAQQYSSGFYNLYHFGVFSQSTQDQNPTPEIGREPGMSFALTLLAPFDKGLQAFDNICQQDHTCNPDWAKGVQWLNRAFFAGAGILMFISGYILTGRLSGAVIAGGAIWLNKHMQKNMDFVISDPLALFLAAAVTLGICLALYKRSAFYWAITGLPLAALILTKAIFFYFILLFSLLACVTFLFLFIRKKGGLKPHVMGVGLLVTIALTPAFLWMERNQEISGQFKLSDSRAGIVMNTREILNHMTVPQYFTSFLYWTRGFGDNVARDHLPKEIWDEFQITNPDGFYLTAQLGYPIRVREHQDATGLSQQEAEKAIDRILMRDILQNPIVHALVTIPVVYRGLWVDQFAYLTIPFLIWLTVLAIRTKSYAFLVVLSPSLFNIFFYASLSLNIPRYQITAGPGLALLLAVGLLILHERGAFARIRRTFSRGEKQETSSK